MRLDTLIVHAGGEPADDGGLAPAIHPASTYRHAPDGTPAGAQLYARHGNPTERRLEAALAALEGGATALVLASGSAAATALLLALERPVVAFHRSLYHGSRELGETLLPRLGGQAIFVDLASAEGRAAARDAGAALLWVETPTNPLLEVLDLDSLAELAQASGALLAVDGTFATPALQRPLAHGADIVLHSTTKALGGHSDVLGGALIFAREDGLAARARDLRRSTGSVASPFASWLVLRGLRSLAVRVERQSANALAVASALHGHPEVAAVLYPGLSDHPGHAVAALQMRRGFGGLLSVRLRGGRDAALRTASRLELFTNATSLGGVESLVEHRASIEGPGGETPDDLLRLSIGLEDPDDLIDDLRRALG